MISLLLIGHDEVNQVIWQKIPYQPVVKVEQRFSRSRW